MSPCAASRWVVLALAALLGLWAGDARAQDATLPARPLPAGITVRAEVDAQSIVIGDRFQYSVLVEGNLVPDQFGYPRFTQGGNLELVSGPNQITQMTFIQGRSTQRYTSSFELRAARVGKVTIPPARLSINGTWYETNAVELEIVDVPKLSEQGGLSSIVSAKTKNREWDRQLQDKYFALIEVPEEAYVGQAVGVPVYVYRDPQFQEFMAYEVSSSVRGDGLIVPDVIQQQIGNRRLRWEQVQLEGRNFVRTLLFTAYFVPTKAGETLMEGPLLRVYLQAANRGSRSMDDLFDMIGPATSRIPAELATRARKVNVLPLPARSDKAIEQIIGDSISIRVETDRDKLAKRELLTLKLIVQGKGFLDLLSAPRLPDFPNLSRIDSSTKSVFAVDRGELVAEKTFEYVYQATDAGDIRIPELTFDVFNPRNKRQSAELTAPLDIKILPDNAETLRIGGTAAEVADAPAAQRERAKARELGRDVAYIDTRPLVVAAIPARNPFFTEPWFWASQLVPLIASLGLGIVMMRRNKGVVETAATRRKKGKRAADTALRAARGQLSASDREQFHATLANGIMEFVAPIVGRASKGLTMEQACALLGERGCAEETTARLAELIGRADAARYSPVGDTPESRGKALSDAESLLDQLQREAKA